MTTLTEAAHKALQNAGVQSQIVEGVLEYKVPDLINHGVNNRGEKVVVGRKPGGWTSCHIINAKNFAAKLQNNRINVTEQDIISNMVTRVVEQKEVIEEEVVEVVEKPKKKKKVVKTVYN